MYCLSSDAYVLVCIHSCMKYARLTINPILRHRLDNNKKKIPTVVVTKHRFFTVCLRHVIKNGNKKRFVAFILIKRSVNIIQRYQVTEKQFRRTNTFHVSRPSVYEIIYPFSQAHTTCVFFHVQPELWDVRILFCFQDTWRLLQLA